MSVHDGSWGWAGLVGDHIMWGLAGSSKGVENHPRWDGKALMVLRKRVTESGI